MPVHHIAVDPVGSGSVDRGNLLAQSREIRSEDRRRDDNFPGHYVPLPPAGSPAEGPPLKTRLASTSVESMVSKSTMSSMRSRSETRRSACRSRMRSTALRIERALEKNGCVLRSATYLTNASRAAAEK